MNSNPDQQPPESEWRRNYESLGSVRRSSGDHMIAGVCGGIARHFNIDPTIVRILFVLLAFFGGAGLLAYLAIWVVTPLDSSPQDSWGDGARRAVIAVAAAFVLFGLVFGGGWDNRGMFWAAFPLAVVVVIGLGLYALFSSTSDRNRGTQMSYAPPVSTPTAETGQTHWAPGSPPGQPTQPQWTPPPPRPKRTGLILFWPTLALIAIGVGILGIFDHSHAVSGPAYFALALAIVGVMTIVGAFVGRPGGLVALGLCTTLMLGAGAVADNAFGSLNPRFTEIDVAPTSAAAVQSSYISKNGAIELDLTEVQDPESLASRTIDLETRTGVIDVKVPSSVPIVVEAKVRSVGAINIDADRFGNPNATIDSRGGFSPSLIYRSPDVTDPAKALTLHINARIGAINVQH